MKKKILAIAALALVAALCLSACGAGGAKAVNLNMATGGTSGTYYGFSGVFANVLNGKMADKLNINVESTGASAANVDLIDTNADQIAIIQNDVMYYAYTGTAMFDKAVTSFSAVMSCYPEVVQLVAAPDIETVEDLRGRTVSVGAADSGTRYNAEQLLAAYGMTFDDINVVYQSFGDSVDSMKNGQIDACFQVAGTPTTAITELSTTYDFNLIGVDDEHVAALQKDYGFYTVVNVPAGTYSCVDHDVQCVAVMATIIARNDVTEDAVYNFIKGMFDYKADISASHVKGEEIDLNTAVSGVAIPWHSGAVKYFAEQGITVG